ncbi:MAG: hypothetical protein QNJ34_03500 [Xenococcaceae cyanobacterium MO_188.B29]|nr:hypothetical protein [Xenococcaceae cyanobacterium MO_188.B29]
MTPTISRENYLKLLDELQLIPKIIETEAEYEQNLALAEKLIAKKQNRSPEETTLLRLLVKFIEDYEENTYNLKEWRDL